MTLVNLIHSKSIHFPEIFNFQLQLFPYESYLHYLKLLFELGSLTEPEAHSCYRLGHLASPKDLPMCMHSGFVKYITIPIFYLGAEDLKSDPSFKAQCLTAELSS